jgi:hypothetical protein
MRSGTPYILSTSAALAVVLAAAPSFAVTITDGFGDADRNNDGVIAPHDTDVSLDGAIDGTDIAAATDAGDTGLIWIGTRGFASVDQPKTNLKVIDDSAGLGSGLALGGEAKGSGSSAAGIFGQSLSIGPNVGDKIVAQFDFRIWTDSANPTPPPFSGEIRWGLFQDTDGQLGQTAAVGPAGANAVWGLDDGEWRGSDPGPRGDKGIYARIPIGAGSDPLAARIVFENNIDNYLEGSSPPAGDVDTVASPTGDGPGGKIGGDLVSDPTNQVPTTKHTLRLEIIRTTDSVEAVTFINGVEVLRDEINAADADVIQLGGVPYSFDYIALRNATGDWDYVIDNVLIQTVAVPEPASLALLGLGGLMIANRRR